VAASLVPATTRLEEAIEELAARQVRVAANALALYPVLRQEMSHDIARDSADSGRGLPPGGVQNGSALPGLGCLGRLIREGPVLARDGDPAHILSHT
jgi:hypothetical protein